MNGRKLSDEECFKRNESMRQSYKLVHQLQDTFMEKIMFSGLTIIGLSEPNLQAKFMVQ